MSRRAVEIFRRRFTSDIFAQNIEAVYYAVLEGKHHA